MSLGPIYMGPLFCLLLPTGLRFYSRAIIKENAEVSMEEVKFPNREILCEMGYNDSVCFENPDYDEAIVGVDSTGG